MGTSYSKVFSHIQSYKDNMLQELPQKNKTSVDSETLTILSISKQIFYFNNFPINWYNHSIYKEIYTYFV